VDHVVDHGVYRGRVGDEVDLRNHEGVGHEVVDHEVVGHEV